MTVPASVAGDVLRALVRDLTARVRVDGGEISPRVRTLLYALHAADQGHPDTPGSAPGTPPPASVTVELSTGEAAALLGCSSEYVRRLARSGRLTARRVGAAWLIDPVALDTYRHGGTECPTPSTRPANGQTPA